MKKILLLGGSAQQIVAIETAKRLGYYTILCDYLTDNPGQKYADKFYLVSTTDKEAILKVAMQEEIDGILAYASDPAAPTAAFVAEKLGLPGNPYSSVDILCNKDKFRDFLKNNGFCTPKAKGYSDIEEALIDISNGYFQMPVIVKPVDSSGSKGANVVKKIDNVRETINRAFEFSRCGRIIVEEFIEKNHDYLIGGDIFVVDGKITMWGLMNCHRDKNVNPLVPVGKSYPLALNKKQEEKARCELQHLINVLEISGGAVNVELIIDKNNDIYFIDIGPRSGGNMIPDLLGMIFCVDIVEMCIKTAMGESVNYTIEKKDVYFATHNLHSNKNGFFRDIKISPQIENYIVKKYIYKNIGEKVEFFQDASKVVGIVFLKFGSMEQMLYMMDNSESWIKIVVE